MAAAALAAAAIRSPCDAALASVLTNVQQDVQAVLTESSGSGFSAMRPNHEPTSGIPDLQFVRSNRVRIVAMFASR